ncbi:hypothetical protein SAMN05216573_110292 [Bradyrhizobium sp. Rc3b]|nr:hypothetical protein [Bradyrhizobium sp. SBR1B]SFN27882.1 hypothetical protein SAMN05216573_110292 [Bradyrhizobium sp. Rc3b]
MVRPGMALPPSLGWAYKVSNFTEFTLSQIKKRLLLQLGPYGFSTLPPVRAQPIASVSTLRSPM